MAIKKPSDWTLFKRLAVKKGAVCYGRASLVSAVGRKVACITWITSGAYRYFAFKTREQLDEFKASVAGAVEIEIARA